MIRGNCSSVHTVNTRIKKYFDAMSLEEARFMNRCYRHVLSGAKGYFTRSVFFSPCSLLPPFKFNIVPKVTV